MNSTVKEINKMWVKVYGEKEVNGVWGADKDFVTLGATNAKAGPDCIYVALTTPDEVLKCFYNLSPHGAV